MIKLQSISISNSAHNTEWRINLSIHGQVEIPGGYAKFAVTKSHKTPITIKIKSANLFGTQEDDPRVGELKMKAALQVRKELTDWAKTSNEIPELIRPELVRLLTVKNPADPIIIRTGPVPVVTQEEWDRLEEAARIPKPGRKYPVPPRD